MGRPKIRPSIEALRTLILLAEKGDLAAAAEQLGIDPSSVSRALGQFQDKDKEEDGLLARLGKRLQLTARGRLLIPTVRQLVRDYEHFVEEFAGPSPVPHQLWLGVGTFGSQFYLPRALREFRGRLTDWRVQTRVLRGRERIVMTALGELDLAVVSHDPRQVQAIVSAKLGGDAVLDSTALGRQRLCAVANRSSNEGRQLAAFPKRVNLPVAKLAEWPLVGLDRESGVRRQLELLLAGRARPLQFAVEAGGWLAAKEYARHGLGVAILPTAMLAPMDLTDLAVRRLPSNCVVSDFIIRRPGPTTPGQHQMLHSLTRATKQQRRTAQTNWRDLLRQIH